MPSVWNSFYRSRAANPNDPALVQPDGTTIILTPGNPGGILSAVAGGTPAVTAVTGVAPITSSGGLTPAIGIPNATSAAKGAVQVDGTTISASAGIISTTAGLKVVTVSLTALQVNAMYATPVEILPAQGAGTVIVVDRVFYDAVFGSAAFTGGGNIGLYYGAAGNANPPAAQYTAAAFLTTFTSNQVSGAGGFNGGSGVVSSVAVDDSLTLSNLTAPFLLGTGATLIVTVNYYVLTGVA